MRHGTGLRTHPTVCNVIGLNPFHFFAALGLVRFIAGLRPIS
jgi:hypothetical protein